MNSKLKILIEAIAGGIGGFLAWVIMEPIPFLTTDPQPGQVSALTGPAFWWSLALFGAILGGGIGGLIGAVEGISTGSRRRFQLAIASGIGIGLFGGMAGLFFGQIVYQSIAPSETAAVTGFGIFAFFQRIIARAIGWALVGVFVGFAQGVPSGSLRKMKHGAIGGVLGGALGGAIFQLLAYILRTPELCRMAGMTTTGAFVGFFVGLVQDLMKHAWVLVERGRNEGREYILDKPESILGRDELADVGVFGDPSVAPQHAVIKAINGGYVVEDLGSATAGTQVNGQRVTRQGLKDGDVLLLGATRVVFHAKAGAAPVRARDVAAPRPHIPAVPSNICAFCGQPKDPVTGACACTPVAAAPSGFSAPGAMLNNGSAMPAANTSAAEPHLRGLSGPLSGQIIPLNQGECHVGREADRDLVINGDPTVSRRHAVVRAAGQEYVVQDEGSANGTFVNNQRVTNQALHQGDRVRFGQSEFLFES